MSQKILTKYKRALDLLDKGLMLICALILAFVMIIYSIEIFTRYCLQYSSTVTGELGLILMTWLYFLGFVILFKRGEDVIMEYFFDRMPLRIRSLIAWLTSWAILVFLLVLVWKSYQFYSVARMMEHPFLPIRYSYTVQPIFVGSILASFVSGYQVLEKTGAFLKGESERVIRASK
jgi:TRAP-type C4-dicarboxylate transport system permease small subunit